MRRVMVGDRVRLQSPRGLRRFAGVITGLYVEPVGMRDELRVEYTARIKGRLDGRTCEVVFECAEEEDMIWMARNPRLSAAWGLLKMMAEEGET